MKQPPAFQFYPADWLGSQRVALLSLEEEGAYIRLLAYCWQHGSIPADTDRLARLIGKGSSTNLARVVASLFKQDPNNPEELRHERLDAERSKQEKWRIKCAAGGRKSAETRLKLKGSSTTPASVVEEYHEDPSKGSSTLYSSSSSINILKGYPSLDQVKEAASLMGVELKVAEMWFNRRAAQDWQKNAGGGQMVKVSKINWRNDLKAWAANSHQYEAEKKPKSKKWDTI